MKKIIFYCFTVVLFTTGCSVKNYLPPGEKLYRGAKIVVNKPEGGSAGSLKKELQVVARPHANTFLLGISYKVWWWYFIGEPKKPKGLKAWLRKSLGEAPVLGSRVNAKANAENMQAYLENNGYFHSVVKGDTVNKNEFTQAVYTAAVSPRYSLHDITWVTDSSALLKELSKHSRGSFLKSNAPYRLGDMEAEKDRLDMRLKTKGYYYFSPEYVMVYADSTIGNHEVNLYLNIKTTTPELAKHAYTINRITLFPNYTLLDPPPDTSKIGTVNVDSLVVRDTVKKFKPELFERTITYRPGRVYSSTDQNATLNRLINLSVFKFVKNRYEGVRDTSDPYRLNVYYYLTPMKKKSLQAEIDGFSKDNQYVGSQLSLNWKNRNMLRGAEQLAIKAYGGFEISTNDSLKKNNNYRIGAEANLTIPRFVLPFGRIKESNMNLPRTQVGLGYEYYIKQSFYAKNVFHLQYQFDWKETANKHHTLAPVAFSYLYASNVTDSFYRAALINPSILLNVYSEAILGSYYTFSYNTLNPHAEKQWYFTGGVDVAGNLAGLITGASTLREKKILNTPFAQYAKVDLDLRYKVALKKNEWANRLQIGLGFPYHNSSFLPFSKQYIIGGSNSVRGFSALTLGPGSYRTTQKDLRYFQTIGGDYKLLINSELRMPLVGKFSTAIFVDVGNIWTKDTLLFGVAGQLKPGSLKELGVAAGVGLRYDAKILLVRFDLGVPLRKPYLPDGHRWVIDQIALGNGQWRGENLVLNIAIGYPF